MNPVGDKFMEKNVNQMKFYETYESQLTWLLKMQEEQHQQFPKH